MECLLPAYAGGSPVGFPMVLPQESKTMIGGIPKEIKLDESRGGRNL